jgi:hypothetical protein
MHLEMLMELGNVGYKQYIPTSEFLDTSRSIVVPTISNLAEDPFIYSFSNENGETFFMWSFIFDRIYKSPWEVDIFKDAFIFKCRKLFVNKDSFLIPSPENINDIYEFDDKNTFTRPCINGHDKYNNLGDKKFIISNCGILFSLYEKVEHKLLTYQEIDVSNVKFIEEKTIIGTLGFPFHVSPIHLIPIYSSFWD